MYSCMYVCESFSGVDTCLPAVCSPCEFFSFVRVKIHFRHLMEGEEKKRRGRKEREGKKKRERREERHGGLKEKRAVARCTVVEGGHIMGHEENIELLALIRKSEVVLKVT